jgi:hypothetical protein
MRALLCALALLIASAPAFAQTHVTEHVVSDATWNVAGSPYIVHGEIMVTGPETTLTIEPGVTVKFDTDAKLSIWSYSHISAVGEPGNEILFTSNADTPSPNDWQSVYAYSAYEAVFTHCVFEYGRYNLYADRCHPTISHCTTRYASSAGIFCEIANPQITDCSIVDNGIGIRLSGVYTLPTIHYCNLYDNNENMYLANYQTGQAGGVWEIDARNNWWGVDTFEEIGQTITYASSADSVIVLYDPWLTEAPVEAASWGAIKAMFDD